MSSRKKACLVWFFAFLCQQTLLNTFLGPCVVFFSLFFFFFPSPGVVCFILRVIWLISESNFAPVLPCTTPLLTDILTFTHFPNLTRCLHSSPANTHTVVSCPLGLKEATHLHAWHMGLGADDAGFRLAAASKVSIQALSPFVYLTRFCTLCSLFPPLCLIN